MNPLVTGFMDESSHTISYVVSDSATGRCAIVDPVLDFDAASGRTGTSSADRIIEYVRDNDLTVDWLLETHVHADHLSAAPYIRSTLGGKITIGEQITEVQRVFGAIFDAEPGLTDASRVFDKTVGDGEVFRVGDAPASVIHTPGHTPACVTYVIGDAAFVGDTLFMPDSGTARADFPGGDASTLYASIQKILALSGDTRLFVCHDYKAPGRDHYQWETTVAAQREANIHVNARMTEADFVALRTARDATLKLPALILHSVQVNIHAGYLPPADSRGRRFLKIPLDAI